MSEDNKNKVLVIDDEEVICDLLEDVLGSYGISVMSAKDGHEGIKLYQQHENEYGLVILDIILPEMDGREVYYKIKKINPEIKILIISGFSETHIIDELKAEGIAGYISKPFSITHITETVQTLLNLL